MSQLRRLGAEVGRPEPARPPTPIGGSVVIEQASVGVVLRDVGEPEGSPTSEMLRCTRSWIRCRARPAVTFEPDTV